MKKKVTFTVKYTTEIEINENEELSDVISNIEIPECEGVEYVCESFDVLKIEDIPE